MSEIPNGTFVNEDVTRLILLLLDSSDLDQARLTCRLYYKITRSLGFWTQKLIHDFGKAEDQIHESDHDEYKFLRFAPMELLENVGRMDVVASRLPFIKDPTDDDLMSAAYFGRIDLIEKFLSQNPRLNKYDAFRYSLKGDQPVVVNWFLDHRHHYYKFDVEEAIKSGNIELVRMTINGYPFYDGGTYSGLLRIAVGHGYVDIIEWLLDEFGPPIEDDDEEDVKYYGYNWKLFAVMENQVKVLDWLWSRGDRPDQSWAQRAVDNFALDSLKWLVAHEIKFDPSWYESTLKAGKELLTTDKSSRPTITQRYELVKKRRRHKKLLDWLRSQVF